MLRILSWSSGLGCDKMHNSDLTMFEPKQQLSSVPDFSLSSAMKRKRSPSCDSPTVNEATFQAKNFTSQGNDQGTQADVLKPVEADIKRECFQSTDSSHAFSSSTMVEGQSADLGTQKTSETRLKRIRQTISAQLSLEILLKHKELRLIDQEIAKCQVALEQLRRCSEIPYPGTQTPSVLVSEGKGAALRKANESFPAKSPAPWGVTDGPYSRHYAQWLLPDARFDGGEPSVGQVQSIMDSAVPARSTRGSFAEAGKSIKSRSTIRGGGLQSLPAGYGQPKEKATGPMILKRKSDDVMVKLVCPDCGRHDFGSAQGFINHCRIGHGRSFASHDAAAEACGEPVEYDNNGTIKGVEPVSTPTVTNMHPLIRSAKLLPPPFSNIPTSTKVSNPKSRRNKKAQPATVAPSFSPSTQTPHLSALIQSQGLGLNLQDLVTEVKTNVEPIESEHEDDEMDIDSPVPSNTGRHPQVAGSKQPAKSTSSKHQPSTLQSRKRFDQETASKSHQATQQQPQLTMHVDGALTQFMHPLIPSPTNESTQAPSLVDDDEEFDPQSPVSSDEIDEAEIDFDVQDDEHPGDRSVLRGGDLPSPPTSCTPAPPSRTHTRRPSANKRTFESRVGDKNVSFASPSPCPEGSDRKRRKIE